jgi:hypothetical protein
MYALFQNPDAVSEISWSQYMKKVSCGAGQRSPDLENSLLPAIQNIPPTANQWEKVVLLMANLGTLLVDGNVKCC